MGLAVPAAAGQARLGKGAWLVFQPRVPDAVPGIEKGMPGDQADDVHQLLIVEPRAQGCLVLGDGQGCSRQVVAVERGMDGRVVAVVDDDISDVELGVQFGVRDAGHWLPSRG